MIFRPRIYRRNDFTTWANVYSLGSQELGDGVDLAYSVQKVIFRPCNDRRIDFTGWETAWAVTNRAIKPI